MHKSKVLKTAVRFSLTILLSSLRNFKLMAVSLGLPLFMLFTFWITTRGDSPDEFDLMGFMFPAIVALSIMLVGLTQATRLSGWRAQGVFERLALTPVPLAYLVLGIAFSQIIIGIIQGIGILLLGAALGLMISIKGALLILAIAPLAAATFIAFGSLVASFTSRSDISVYVFLAIFLPIFFLGGFPSHMLPATIQKILPWLPTSMAIRLISSLFAHGNLPDNAWFSITGLLIYGLIFAVVASKWFRWEA